MNFQNSNIENAAKMFNRASRIGLIGNGGNLSVAQHMASDIYRHTDKFCFAPDSISITAFDVDGGWHQQWIDYACHTADLIIGITCRMQSPLVSALEDVEYGMPVLLIAPEKHSKIETIVLDVETYHEFEVNAIWTMYMLMEYNGITLPKLP
jgi:DNA-binding MurR/RpiR family transcriptional regulator